MRERGVAPGTSQYPILSDLTTFTIELSRSVSTEFSMVWDWPGWGGCGDSYSLKTVPCGSIAMVSTCRTGW